MKFVPVEKLPERARRKGLQCPRKDLSDIIDRFIASDATVARIELDDGEYRSPKSCLAAFHSFFTYNCYGGVKAAIRCGQVYLIKEG